MTKTATERRSKPPGAHCLRLFHGKHGEKCSCKSANVMMPSGCWIVEHQGRLYTFEPSTQLQKDFWLSAARQTIGESKAIAMLRWYCFTCQTVQTP
jgi:hypothetical protein